MSTRLAPTLALAAAALATAVAANAATTSDHPAAMLVYPHVRVDGSLSIDTTIQLTNEADHPVDVSCFYEISERACVGGQEGESCDEPSTCSGVCQPALRRVPFRVRLTRQQPLAWPVSSGLTTLPLDGVERVTVGGESNATTDVPGLGDGPLLAAVRCAVVETDGRAPSPDNALVGLATIARSGSAAPTDADAVQYRAIGVPAVSDAPNGDDALQLGGPDAEYAACPSHNILDFVFYGAPAEVAVDAANVETNLVLVACGSSPEAAGSAIVQFLVYNEFGQRFSTSKPVSGQLTSPLANLDTNDPTRSIFSARVSGTVAGKVQMQAIGDGMHALAFESHRQRNVDVVHSTAIELSQAKDRTTGDRVVLPPPACAGDCDADGAVSISELITSVGIAIEGSAVGPCRVADRNRDGRIAIDELIASVSASLEGCPTAALLPTATPSPRPTSIPTVPVTSVGPQITFLGFATADDRPLAPSETDGEGRPVYDLPSGGGATLVVEARRGTAQRPVGQRTYDETGEAPDLQVLSSLPLGNGDAAVCEDDGVRGGIPAVPSLDFSDDPATVAAMNDLGCRAYERQGNAQPCTRAANEADTDDLFAFVDRSSERQFCIPIARPWAFPPGQSTVLAARVRDAQGNLGDVREVVVRVPQLPD
jgi:hypothetical protein